MPDLHPPSPEDTLNDFLISVERRAFKRAAYAVRDDDAALDIVQATANFNDAKLIAELSCDLGEAMVGINEQEIQIIMEERGQ